MYIVKWDKTMSLRDHKRLINKVLDQLNHTICDQAKTSYDLPHAILDIRYPKS